MSVRNWALLGFLSLLWGGSFFFVEVALRGLPALSIVWARVALAAVLLAGVHAVTRMPLPKGRRVWAALGVMGLLNNAVPFTLFALAQGQISSGLAAILNAMTPLFTVIVAHLATEDEKAGLAKWLGVGAGLAGVAVLVKGEAAGTIGAMLACLVAALSYALAAVWGRRFRHLGLAPLSTAFGQVAASSMMLAPLWLVIDRPWQLGMPEAPVIWAVIGIAVLSTALAYLVYFRLLASAGATRLALVTFLIPVSATGLGVGLLGEPLLLRHLAGFALIAAGLIAIDRGQVRRR